VPWLGGGEVSGMGGGNGCLLGGGEGVRGGVVFAFFFCGLESRGSCGFRCVLGFSLQSGIALDLSPEARIFLS